MFEETNWAEQEVVLKQSQRIFIDTCSLIWIEKYQLESFWQRMTQFVLEGGAHPLIIAFGVYAELQKHSRKQGNGNSEDQALAKWSSQALQRISYLQSKNIVELMGDTDEYFADNVLHTVFTKYRLKYYLMLITQDYKLGQDIFHLNNTASVEYCKKISVRKLIRDGRLQPFDFDPDQEKEHTRESGDHINKAYTLPTYTVEDKFQLKTKVTDMLDDHLFLHELAGTGSQLETEDKEIVSLGKQLAQGGEGTVYETNDGQVAKIYVQHCLTRWRREKLGRMVQHKLKFSGICWPTHLLYNQQHEFVGFTMPKAEGKVLQTAVCIKKTQQKYFPDWTKYETIQLCLTILEKIHYLHAHNVLLGDINLLNILVKSSTDVYFVDTDSYQIEEFPCPVGTITFTAPEVQKRKHVDYLKTLGNENFAVATLLFMIMLPGKAPYTQQDGESGVRNILDMQFPYAYEENTTGRAPEGPWRYIWSHLPYKMKKAFYETFMIGQAHSTEATRYSVDDWIQIFNSYAYSLKKHMVNNDPQALELYPTRLKRFNRETTDIQEKNMRIGTGNHQQNCQGNGKAQDVVCETESHSGDLKSKDKESGCVTLMYVVIAILCVYYVFKWTH